MILASNSVKAFRVSVAPSEFISNVAEFGNPMFRLESLNPKESGDAEEKLPEGYTRVGWIAGAGDALIDTGYYPNHNSEILIDRSGLMDYEFGMFGYGSAQVNTSSGEAEGYMIMGQARSDYASLTCILGAVSMADQEQGEAIMFPIPHEDVGWEPSGENPFEGYEADIAETRYSIYMSKDELRVGPNSVPNPATPVSIDPWPIPFTLFGSVMSYGSDIEDEPMPDMIFSFKVSENGVPVVNMLPCIEDATGQPGFYDTVRGIFITGEGMFFTGEAAEPEPEEPLPANLYLFNDCTHYSQVGEIYPSYQRRISDWNYYLNNLQIGGDVDGSMFAKTDGSANTTLKTFSVDLPALTDGERMFYRCNGLTSWDIELPNLTNGVEMFLFCRGLTSFEGDMPALTNGEYMFNNCTGLTSFNVELPALTNGFDMFYNTGLTSWDIELPKLTNGERMFYNCTGLTSFTGDMPALTNSTEMFYNCTKLTSFTGDLSALTDVNNMFSGCTGLTSFEGDLPALTDGTNMFSGCKLDAPSVLNIAESINDEVVDAPLGIGIDCSSDMSELDSFARDIYYEDWSDLCRAFYDKGWTVTWGDTDGNSTIYTKYIDCVNVSEVSAVNSNYKNDLRNNKWVYLLDNLTNSYRMFRDYTKLTSWDTELPALTNGYQMFYGCTGLASFTGDLSALTNGDQMFYWCQGLTSWDIELPNMTVGSTMFYNCTKLTSFNVALPALTNGSGMFRNCIGLTSWDIELPNLTEGSGMFRNTGLTSWDIALPALTKSWYMFQNTGLTSWDIELPALTDGYQMFEGCTKLTSFTGDLPKLTEGGSMFWNCTGLTSFNVDLPALTVGFSMFQNTGLTSWDIELPKLYNGNTMFSGTGLTSFNVDLPALTNGHQMFGSDNSTCTKLDLASVQRMANTINNISEEEESNGKVGWGELSLGMDASLQDTEELETALAAIRAKGWTVTEMYRS